MDVDPHELTLEDLEADAWLERRRRRMRRALRIAVPSILAVGVGSVAANAAISSRATTTEIKACYIASGRNVGNLRIAAKCRAGEKAISWNQRGLQGLPGIQGPAGAAGANGSNGADGAQGLIGLTGSQGPKGDTGATGATGATGPAGPQGPAGPAADAGPDCAIGRAVGGVASNQAITVNVSGVLGDSRVANGLIDATNFCVAGAPQHGKEQRGTFGTFTVIKDLDRATGPLIDRAIKGTIIPTTTIELRKQAPATGALETFATYDFTDLRVIGEHLRRDDGRLIEQTTFGFRSMAVKYKSPNGESSFLFDNTQGYEAPPVPACEDAHAATFDNTLFVRHESSTTGIIPGDSVEADHRNWSNASSFCFGVVGASVDFVREADETITTQPAFTTFGIGKPLDRATPAVLGTNAISRSTVSISRFDSKLGRTVTVLDLQYTGNSVGEYLQGTNGLTADAEWMSFQWASLAYKYNPAGQILQWNRTISK